MARLCLSMSGKTAHGLPKAGRTISGASMRTLLTAAFATSLLLAGTARLQAQDEPRSIYISPTQQPDPRQLPKDIADSVIRFFNAPGTLRFSGISRIPAARGIDGDVAVLGGPVTVAG